jgi:hypothetical protein
MKYRVQRLWAATAATLAAVAARPAAAEYYEFNAPKGADILSQEVRWPFWAESTYNAIWTSEVVGEGRTSAYFYGGVPEASPDHPVEHPASIIWSFWPVSHPVGAGDTVSVSWGHPQMYAPLVVGEGASGKASGEWPQLKARQWYQFVMRVWQPVVDPSGHAFVGQWMRDPADGRWYHLATMEVPFRATGIQNLGGFIEDFSHGNRNPRRTEFRNVYGHAPGGGWASAPELTPSVRQHRERGTVGLADGGTAGFFETCSGPTYHGNLDYDGGAKKLTVTLRQPATPAFAPPAVRSSAARRSGRQVLVTWDVPPTAPPQLAWRAEGLDAAGHPVFTAEARDPEARQAIVDVPGDATIAKVRLTLTDIFDRAAMSPAVVPTADPLRPAATATDVEPGLDFAYFEASEGQHLDHLPDVATLAPQLAGTVNGLDLTVRRRRTRYAVDYTGYLLAPTDGIYGFRLASYDGARLRVDGVPVVDDDGVHSYTDRAGHIALARGPHTIDVEHFCDVARGEGSTYADRMDLSWEGPGLPLQPVPATAFARKRDAARVAATLVVPPGTMPIDNATATLDVSVGQGAASVNRVAYYVGDVLWADRDAAPWAAQTMLPDGAFDVRARLFTAAGQAYDTPAVHVQTRQAATAPWQVTQVGTPPPRRPLGAAVTGADAIAMSGDGTGIAWQQVTGDVTVTAHVAARPDGQKGGQDDGTRPDGEWMGGVLFRADLAAHDTFLGESFCAAYARVDGSTHLQCPLDHNGGGPVAGPDLGQFDWVRLARHGRTFAASFSNDGATWTDGGTRTLDLPDKLYAGVFIFSRAGYNPEVNRWRFDHVTVAPTP